MPNSVYSQGIPKSRFCGEANRFVKMTDKDQFMTVEKFYKDKFALVIDLRSSPDKMKTAGMKKIVNTQNGVLLEIKKNSTSSSLNCYIYIYQATTITSLLSTKTIDGISRFADWQYTCLPSIRTST